MPSPMSSPNLAPLSPALSPTLAAHPTEQPPANLSMESLEPDISVPMAPDPTNSPVAPPVTASPITLVPITEPTSPTPYTMVPVSPAPSAQCFDIHDYVDSYGDGCSWYEKNDSQGCPNWADCCDGGMGTPHEGCCWCGGGISLFPISPQTSSPTASPTISPTPRPTSSPTVKPTISLKGSLEPSQNHTTLPVANVTTKPSSGCRNYPNYLDSYGDGCSWYESNDNQGCTAWTGCCDGGMGKPTEACCWCGGGINE